MAIDLYQSRKARFNRCEYYRCENPSNIDLNILIHNLEPEGIFYAVETTPIRNDGNEVAGFIRFDRSAITINTDDDVSNLKVDDIVVFKGEVWLVVDIQSSISVKRSEFSRFHQYGTTTISLRK